MLYKKKYQGNNCINLYESAVNNGNRLALDLIMILFVFISWCKVSTNYLMTECINTAN